MFLKEDGWCLTVSKHLKGFSPVVNNGCGNGGFALGIRGAKVKGVLLFTFIHFCLGGFCYRVYVFPIL